ncbi:MAG: hypothetical protein JO153_08715 [Solirubrobacterales bacterium]|nr:hypothetical protein [Solirubrobacterales bacterium]MBV9916570.1 hypothetical protein [Solirubrobacterales bacterium]
MKRIIAMVAVAAAVASVLALAGTAAARRKPRVSIRVSAPVTRTFSFIGDPNGPTSTLFNINGLLINARCDSRGAPIIFAFSSASKADLFGRFFDGLGRLHNVKNSDFTKSSRGEALYSSSGDYDASGTVLFETSDGKVVTINYAFDNASTLSKQNVCTVYGSFIAT